MGTTEVYEIIDSIRAAGCDPRLERIEGTYRFDIDGVGTWRIHVDHGHTQVDEGPGDADCIIGCSPHDFVRIIRGEQNLITAEMQGRVHFEGDQLLALKLHGILPSPTQDPMRPAGR